MKKFNVKALSLAVAAAVVSSAAGAAERDLGSIPEKAQNAMAFQTVFGENTKFDEDTGKFTFDKDSSALLLKTMELEQAVNGFAAGSNFVATNEDGKKTVREATNADIAADSMKGVGLAGGITAVNTRVDNLAKDIDEALDEQDKAVDQLVDELKNTIASNNKKIADDMAEMGKEISGKFNDVDNEISKASSELSESIEKVAGDVTAVNTRVDSLAQDTADAKAAAKAAEDKVTALSANVDSKVKEAKDAADKAVDAASKIDAVADKADKASKGVVGLTKALEAAAEQAALASAENAQALNGFAEGDEIVVTDENGIKSIKTATKEDVENADFEGVGLKEIVEVHDKALDDLAKSVTVNNDALVKTAEVVNDISKDVTANKEAIKTKADKTDIDAVAEKADKASKGVVGLTKALEAAAEQAALASAENAQALNGFAEGDEIVVTDENGIKSIKTATKEDVENADFEGVGLKEIVEVHDKALDDLAKSVTVNNDALVKTAEVVNDISKDVTANKEAIKTKADQTAVESVKTIAVEAKESVQAVQGAVEAAQKSAETAKSHAKAAQTSADAANNVASAAQTAAAQAQDAVKANEARVAANKADIATLQTASSQHAAGIAKNSARIDSLDKNVANLRKETRQGLAAQAALSGLFQPYSVGKFNVTAALGGFKSDTAVAVGAGYRFNENFAAKAGLAVGTSSGSSASYNVGVNYEW